MDILKSEIYVILMNMTKDMINDYRKLLGCDVKSNLNKSDMAAGVAQYIEEESELWLRRIPTWELAILHKLVELKPGEKLDAGCQPMTSILEQLKLIQAEEDPSNLHIYYSLTPTMHRSIKAGLERALAYVIDKDYPLLDQFVMGLLNIYGFIPKPALAAYVMRASIDIQRELGVEDPDGLAGYFYPEESLLVNFNMVQSREGLDFVFHPCIEGSVELFNTILRCPESIKYKKFTYEEFMAAGEGYPFITTALETEEGFKLMEILETFTASRDYAEYLFCDIYTILQEEDEDRMTMLNLSFNEAKHISVNQINEYREALQTYKEVMPRWDLRGHSISEIRGTGKKATVLKMPNPFDYVAKKLDPNKPCPCGSGKKYKDCHGRLS